MTYFTEIDWEHRGGGVISNIIPDSLAAEIGVMPGDELLAVNGHQVEDVIDVQFYSAEENLELLIRRDSEYFIYEAYREYDQPLGLEFKHPTFDIDIRRCNNLCEFCFVLQMAPRFRRTLYIKDDDYRYSFLFGHFVTLTNLNDDDWAKIENMRLSPLYVSVHVTDLALRRSFLRNEKAPDIIEQLTWLADRGIQVHTQLVVVPSFNDGEWLVRSINELAELWPAVLSISVVPVGLTKHHKYGMRPHTPEEAAALLKFVEPLRAHFYKTKGIGFVYPTDEWYLVTGQKPPGKEFYDELQLQENGLGGVRDFLDEWDLVKREISEWLQKYTNPENSNSKLQYDSIFLVTGTLFTSVLQEVASDFSDLTGVETHVIPVVNQRLGSTITVAGLLMAEDVIEELNSKVPGELIILPRVMFDHPDIISLDNVSPGELSKRFNRPVALADQMGDVWDVLRGQAGAIYYPNGK